MYLNKEVEALLSVSKILPLNFSKCKEQIDLLFITIILQNIVLYS